MRYRLSCLFVAFALCGLSAGLTRAEQTGPNPQVGLFGGGQFGNDEMKSGASVLGSVGVRYTPFFSIDLQGGWMPATSKMRNLSAADLSITSLEFIPRIYAPTGRVQPYLGAGAARFFINEQLDPAATAGGVQSEDVNNKWGGVFGGGVEVAVNENMAIVFDVSYLYLRTSVTTTRATAVPGITQTSTHPLHLDAVRALAGFRVKFNSPGWTNVY